MVDIDTLADVVAFTERLVEALRQPIRAADKEFGGRSRRQCCASSAARKRKESLASLARLTQQVRVRR